MCSRWAIAHVLLVRSRTNCSTFSAGRLYEYIVSINRRLSSTWYSIGRAKRASRQHQPPKYVPGVPGTWYLKYYKYSSTWGGDTLLAVHPPGRILCTILVVNIMIVSYIHHIPNGDYSFGHSGKVRMPSCCMWSWSKPT